MLVDESTNAMMMVLVVVTYVKSYECNCLIMIELQSGLSFLSERRITNLYK